MKFHFQRLLTKVLSDIVLSLVCLLSLVAFVFQCDRDCIKLEKAVWPLQKVSPQTPGLD